MRTTNTTNPSDTQTSALCPHTQTRREACACGSCGRRTRAEDKYRANRRDARALLDLIAGRLDCDSTATGELHWGHVGDMALLRERLLEIVVGFALGPDGNEGEARRHIEEALAVSDDEVADALIEAM